MSQRRKRTPLTARRADKFELYEKSVQCTEAEIAFIDRVFRRERGRRPESLREDFCGTALLCADWVKSRKTRTAVGVDLDAPTLDYGRRRHIEPLGDASARVTLLNQNVLDPVQRKVDVAVAFNFSYCVFKERQTMLRYFRGVRAGLERDGVFMLDIYGGPDAQEELVERKRMRGFTYVWDQRPLDAINAHAWRYIHFEFRDGTRLWRAFSYDWRIWTLPELRDLLDEAGYSRVDIYWEGSDARGQGNGIFRRVARADNEKAWIAYVVAWR